MATSGVWKLQQVRDQVLCDAWPYSTLIPTTLSTPSLLYSVNTGGSLNAQNDTIARSSPIQIPGCWTWIAPTRSAAAAIRCDGTLWAWGNNDSGGMGQNSTAVTTYSSPVQIPGTTWCCVFSSTDNQNFFAIKSDGTAWAWGNNDSGNLGLNISTHVSSPVQLPGNTWCWFDGTDNAYAGLKTDGTLWTWGGNGNGQLGLNDVVSRSSPVQVPGTNWRCISGLHQNMYALKTDGTLWTWGSNGRGQLGVNDVVSRSSPVQVPGTTWQFIGPGGYEFSGAVKTDGTLWTWGKNDGGFLGVNDTVSRSSPVQVPGTWYTITNGQDQSVGLKTDGTMWAWGSNCRNGTGGLIDFSSSPVQVPGTWLYGYARNDGSLFKRNP